MRLGEETHAQAASLCNGRFLAGLEATVSAARENATLTMMLDCNCNRHELRKTIRDLPMPGSMAAAPSSRQTFDLE